MRNYRYLIRLLVFSLGISLVPIAILGAIFYIRSVQAIESKVIESNALILSQTQMRVEQDLKTIDNMVTQFISSPLVAMSMKMALTPDDFRMVDDLHRSLHYLQSFELGVSDVVLWNIQHDWVLSNEGLFAFRDSRSARLIHPYLNMKNAMKWDKHCEGSAAVASCSLWLIKKIPVNYYNPSGMLITKVAGTEIDKLLGQEQTMGETFILDERFRIIAHPDEQRTEHVLPDDAFMGNLAASEAEAGFSTEQVGGQKTVVAYRKSAYNGWWYVSLVPMALITEESRTIGLLAIYSCLGVVALALCVSYFGSRTMHVPIRNLYLAVLAAGRTDPSGKRDELQAIGHHIHALVQNQKRLANRLVDQDEQIRELFLMKLFTGEAKGGELGEKLFALFPHCAGWERMCVLALQIDTLEGTRYSPGDKDLMMFAIHNIVGELIPAEERLGPLIAKDSLAVLLRLPESPEQFPEPAYRCAESVQNAVDHYLHLQVSIGVSRPFAAFAETHKACREAAEALKFRLRLGSESILYIEDIQQGQSSAFLYPAQLESELIDAVKLGDEARANLLLDQLLAEIFKDSVSPQGTEMMLIRLLARFISAAQETGEAFRPTDDGERSLFDRIYSFKTLPEVSAWFRGAVMKPVLDLLEEKRSRQYKTISEGIIRLIEEHYQSDLTLEACAARLNFNPNYVSRVFAKETGVTFSDYLGQYRLAMAKKWLADTDDLVAEIAERLHYHNSQNFIRSFRKAVGMTPGQYREACRAKHPTNSEV